MDNTFENGFMCGLLMNSVDNKYIEPKEDATFDFILHNIIPVMSIKISEKYKIVRGIIDCTGKHANIFGMKYGTYYDSYCKTDDRPLTAGYGTFLPVIPTINIETACILYKNGEPQWARIGVDNFIRQDRYFVFNLYKLPYATPETVQDANDMTEVVFAKSETYKFLPESVQYAGDYTIVPPPYSEFTGYGYNLYGSIRFQDESGNVINYPKCNFEIEKTFYNYEYTKLVDNPNDPGHMIPDSRYPPNIKVSDTSIESESIDLFDYCVDCYAVCQYNSIDGRTYTDLSNGALVNLDYDIMTDIVKEIGDPRFTKVIKGRLIN